MLSSDEEKNEVFFDTFDSLLSEESCLAEEELGFSKLDNRIWISEPASVKERRENFLQAMGLTEFVPKRLISNEMEMDIGGSLIGLNRLSKYSGAVASSYSTTTSQIVEKEGCHLMEQSRTNCISNELEQTQMDKTSTISFQEAKIEYSNFVQDCLQSKADGRTQRCQIINFDKKKMRSWWKRFLNNRRGRSYKFALEKSKIFKGTTTKTKIQVQQNKKSCLEFTAPYFGQEIPAHKGFIHTMKFSPDGQYLASGGEDGIVRVWRVLAEDISSNYFAAAGNLCNKVKAGKSNFLRKHSVHASVVFPNKVFRIEESPLHEFHGHSGDVLDLAWSNSNMLISSSKDETVLLWKVGCSQCFGTFQHSNYVTCIQFNPANENYFISGSIDGKVRIWGLSEKRVVDWADVREVVTAVSYQPDGKGFVVGSINGACSFYKLSGEFLMLDVQIHTASRKKATGNKITCIKFSQEKPQRLMISSEDSKLRIFDGGDLIHKYKGLPKSGCQKSVSFASIGRHIISVGEDSCIYVWNNDDLYVNSANQKKSVGFCEHFFIEDVSVAIPWSVAETKRWCNDTSSQCSSQTYDHQDAIPTIKDSERFSFSNWLSIDGPCRGSATFPEEQLPSWDLLVPEGKNQYWQHAHNKLCCNTALSETWGLVIVTAGGDGVIRTFHNYGLPLRI